MTFADYIAAHLNTPFEWGRHDCVLFAAGWVRIATGMDPLDGVQSWATERDALRAVRAIGGLEAAIDARFERIHPHLACDGDLGLVDGALVLFSGANVIGPGERGLTTIDRMRAQCAWKIRG